jgi:hypothetical protein
MINKFDDNVSFGQGILGLFDLVMKGCKNLISTGNNITEMSVNYKQQYLDVQKKLNMLEKELMGLSKSLKSDSTVYWNYSNDYIDGMQRYSIKVDRIINRHFNPVVVTDMFGTGAWKNPIFRPVMEKSI